MSSASLDIETESLRGIEVPKVDPHWEKQLLQLAEPIILPTEEGELELEPGGWVIKKPSWSLKHRRIEITFIPIEVAYPIIDGAHDELRKGAHILGFEPLRLTSKGDRIYSDMMTQLEEIGHKVVLRPGDDPIDWALFYKD